MMLQAESSAENQNKSAPVYLLGSNYNVEPLSIEVEKLREEVERLKNENELKFGERMLMEDEEEIKKLTSQVEFLKKRHETKSAKLKDLKKKFVSEKSEVINKENLTNTNKKSDGEEKLRVESRIKGIEEELKKSKQYFEDIQKVIEENNKELKKIRTRE